MSELDTNNKRFQVSLTKTESRPDLHNMVKAGAISLTKKGLSNHTAKVAMCVDLSGSMYGRLRSGKVTKLLKQALALGLTFDDDGDIEVFVFGSQAQFLRQMELENLDEVANQFTNIPTMGMTNYGDAINTITSYYKNLDNGNFEHPVFVNFITDGDVNEQYESDTIKAIKDAAKLPIFWSFCGIGANSYLPLNDRSEASDSSADKPGFFARLFGLDKRSEPNQSRQTKLAEKDFKFLMHLDDMSGRVVDNASFFAVGERDVIKDSVIFEHMHVEYPDWLKEVKAKNILK
ncbi:VWA domain-containing protein [Vibrio splendidus]